VPLLQKALNGGELTFSLTYADICRRNLDGGNHTIAEAAEWYIKGAEAGDGDAISYLKTLPTIQPDSLPASKVSELTKIWTAEELIFNANRGFELYKSGDFVSAAKYLKKASLGYHPLAQELYADICLRELDEKPHTLKEAAMWYLLSALGGDPQSHSYLMSIVPSIFNDQDPDRQMECIVRKWVYDLTIGKITPVLPKDINNFLVFEFGRNINKTTAQKLPYFFDKFVNALLCSTGELPQTVVEEFDANAMDLSPRLEASGYHPTCKMEYEALEGRHLIRHSVSCFTFGPVYFSYFKTLDSIEDGFIPKPAKAPKIGVVYEFILRSVQEATKNRNAASLTNLSHQEYPWLLAGFKFWREKYTRQEFPLQGHSEQEILQQLTEMKEPFEEDDIAAFLKLLEDDNIWPNDIDHPVTKEFDENVRRFFSCHISMSCPLVQEMQRHFFESLISHTLDCTKKTDLEILQTSLLMYHCEFLVLNNLESNSGCYKALCQGQRYFYHLVRLDLQFTSTFNDRSTNGKKIIRIVHKITKRGFDVTQRKAE
jgi:hypothetical protein